MSDIFANLPIIEDEEDDVFSNLPVIEDIEQATPKTQTVTPDEISTLNQTVKRANYDLALIPAPERNFAQTVYDKIRFNETNQNNFTFIKNALDNANERFRPIAPKVAGALALAAPFTGGTSLILQALIAGGTGVISSIADSYSKSDEIRANDFLGDGGRDAAISLGVDILMPRSVKVVKAIGSKMKGGLVKVAKPVLETAAAREVIKKSADMIKNLDNVWKETSSKLEDALFSKSQKDLGDVTDALDLVTKDIEINKLKSQKSFSGVITKMKKTLSDQYTQIFDVSGHIPVNIESEIDTVIDLLGVNKKGLDSSKSKIKALFQSFGVDMNSLISGKVTKNAARDGVDLVTDITFKEAHTLKQSLSKAKNTIMNGSDSTQKNLLAPVLDDVIHSLENKLENISGDVYKKTNQLWRITSITEDFVSSKLGKIKNIPGYEGLRLKTDKAFNKLINKGVNTAEGILEDTDDAIKALISQNKMLIDSGFPNLKKYGEALDLRVKKIAGLGYRGALLDKTMKDLQSYNPKNDPIMSVLKEKTLASKDLIEKEVQEAKKVLPTSRDSNSMLALAVLGSSATFFLPEQLRTPVRGFIAAVGIRTYSPAAAKLSLEMAESIAKSASKMQMNEAQKKVLAVLLKRGTSITMGELDDQEEQ